MRELLVIGGGPAGLAAAVEARACGASVVLLESSDELGGQYWRHLPASRPSVEEQRLHHGWDDFQAMRRLLIDDPGCHIYAPAQVWAISADGDQRTAHVLFGDPDAADSEHLTFTPDAMVLATGAHDRTLPFPGWDLPGVFTAGGAQALAKGERIRIGDRVLVAGAGPFLLPVVQSLTKTGARVLGVLEANRLPRLAGRWLARPWQLLPAWSKGMELAGYVAGQLRHGIPYRTGIGIVAAHGTDRVTSVTTARLDANWVPIPGSEQTVEVDAICVGHGFTPRLELPIAAGCALDQNRYVIVDDQQRTSVPGVYAAGEITGIGGVDLALAEGTLAGNAAGGGPHSARHRRRIRRTERRRRVFRGFAARIETAHGIRPGWPAWLTADTIICRCEEVGYGRLCATAASTGSTGLRSLKLSTRAGLGICQGRICGRSVEELLAAQTPGGCLTGGSHTDRRPIAAPIRLGDLASTPDTATTTAGRAPRFSARNETVKGPEQ